MNDDRLLDAVYDGPVPIDALVEHDGKVGDLVGTLWAALFLVSLTSRVQIGVRFFLPMISLAAVGLAASAGLALALRPL